VWNACKPTEQVLHVGFDMMISVWGWSAKNKATSQKVLELPGCAICSVGCEILVLSQEED